MLLQKFFDRLYPADVFGLFVIIGGFYLLLKGIDHVVGGVVIMVVTYYFVRAKKHVESDNTKPDASNGGV